jgi:hypothetical protein
MHRTGSGVPFFSLDTRHRWPVERLALRAAGSFNRGENGEGEQGSYKKRLEGLLAKAVGEKLMSKTKLSKGESL